MGTHLLFSISVVLITIFLNWYWAKKTIRKEKNCNFWIFICNLVLFVSLKLYNGFVGVEFVLLLLTIYWLVQKKVKKHNPTRYTLEEMSYDPSLQINKHWQQTTLLTKLQGEENKKQQQYRDWYTKYLGYMIALIVFTLIISAIITKL